MSQNSKKKHGQTLRCYIVVRLFLVGYGAQHVTMPNPPGQSHRLQAKKANSKTLGFLDFIEVAFETQTGISYLYNI